jgi:hypothetical protein
MEKRLKDKRVVLLVLPLLILPFLALGFYALDGGQGAAGQKSSAGINASLPSAKFKKNDPTDKMGFYELGERDSIKTSGERNLGASSMSFNQVKAAEAKSVEIDERLLKIKEALGKKEEEPGLGKSSPLRRETADMKSDVDRLELLMKTMQAPKGEDEELKQLTQLMEKIAQVQNPASAEAPSVSEPAILDNLFAAIPALVLGRQTLQQGSSMQLSLVDSVILSGVMVPAGTMLFGLCQLTNQRLLLDIKTIRLGNRILPVDLTLYGLDGIKGIFTPDALIGNAVNGGTDDAVRGMRVMSIDGSMGAQVAGAGIDAAKSLFSKKVKRVKVKVKAGLPVLLRNNADKRKPINGQL